MLQYDGFPDKSEKISNTLENDLRSVNNFYFSQCLHAPVEIYLFLSKDA